MNPRDTDLVETKDLVKKYRVKSAPFQKALELSALQGVSLSIRKGETLGLVGESGCGKTTLGRCLLKLVEPSSGEILFDGNPLSRLSAGEMRPYRRRMQIIFQDPYSSLNPRMTVGSILDEPLVIHRLCEGRKAREKRVEELLDLVGLSKDIVHRYPHEFSGGQRQRVGIARALAVQPEFIVCDEPVSALDVSIQAQIINLLMDLQQELGLTYLFISHDLRVVRQISHRVAVMYLGKIVELADCASLYEDPKHPYTRALLSAVPQPTPGGERKRIVLGGEPPHATRPPEGCQFHPRCFMAEPRCSREVPELKSVGETQERSQKVSCLLVK